jgi:hypothetical protein
VSGREHDRPAFDPPARGAWDEEDWGFLALNWGTLSYLFLVIVAAGAAGSFAVVFVGFMLPVVLVCTWLLVPF